jgi:putative transposase
LTSKSIYRAFKFRLYPTKEHFLFFERSVGCARFVYNKLLEASIAEYQSSGKFILGYDLTNRLVELKKEFPWLKEVNSQSLQQASMNLAAAFKNRFSKKLKKQAGFPKFKKRGNQDSFMIPQHFIIKKNQIKLPKIGWVSAATHRKLEGKVKSITISKDVDQWFVSILCELPEKTVHYDPNNAVGIDLGIKTFAVTSDGECIAAPVLEKEHKKLKKLQRRHAKKTKDGKNREKVRKKVARQYRKIKRITKNFVETTSSLIAKEYDVVSVETLNIQGMKAMWNHWIPSGQCFSMIVVDSSSSKYVSILFHTVLRILFRLDLKIHLAYDETMLDFQFLCNMNPFAVVHLQFP